MNIIGAYVMRIVQQLVQVDIAEFADAVHVHGSVGRWHTCESVEGIDLYAGKAAFREQSHKQGVTTFIGAELDDMPERELTEIESDEQEEVHPIDLLHDRAPLDQLAGFLVHCIICNPLSQLG